MPNLKDFLLSDLDTFFNVDEFSEVHNIDGLEIPAIIDSNILKGRPRQPEELYNNVSGVYVSEIVLYIKEVDLTYRPVISEHLRVDGNLYLVSNCNENNGLLEITLEVNEA